MLEPVPRKKAQPPKPLAVRDVVDQHIDSSTFLWDLRRGAAGAPHYSLRDFARTDTRIGAHIDGLRIAGEDGWQLCKRELAWKEPGEVFAAAVLALESGDQAKMQSVLAVAARTLELSRGFISALGWLEYQQAEPHINGLCVSSSPAERRIGIAAAAIYRKDPGRP